MHKNNCETKDAAENYVKYLKIPIYSTSAGCRQTGTDKILSKKEMNCYFLFQASCWHAIQISKTRNSQCDFGSP